MSSLSLDKLASNVSELKLLESRTIFIAEPINAAVAKRAISHLLALDTEAKSPIKVFINSPGGEVNSGYAIMDCMRYIESEVINITNGLCASIATVINMGAKKENRLGLPSSKYLIHQPLIGGHVQGVAADLEITKDQILKTRKNINELLAKECGQPFERVQEDTKRDYWMDAEEAVKYGLISRVISSAAELK